MDAGGFAGEVCSGDRRRGLEALRAVLAASIECCEPREVAPLARQLQLVMKDLDELPAVKEVSFIDSLAARRADRIAEAKTS